MTATTLEPLPTKLSEDMDSQSKKPRFFRAYHLNDVRIAPESKAIVDDQIFQAHRWRNDHVEVIAQFREERDRLKETIHPQYKQIKDRIAQIDKQIAELKEQRKQARVHQQRKRIAFAGGAKLKELQKEKASLKPDLAKAREKATEMSVQPLQQLNERENAAKNAVYGKYCTHGSLWYMVTQYYFRFGALAKAKNRRRWCGDGLLAIFVDGKAARCQIERLPDIQEARTVTTRAGRVMTLQTRKPGSRRSGNRLAIRFSPAPTKQPFVTFYASDRFTLPDVASVVWLSLRASHVGPRKQYDVTLLAEVTPEDTPAAGGMVGLHANLDEFRSRTNVGRMDRGQVRGWGSVGCFFRHKVGRRYVLRRRSHYSRWDGGEPGSASRVAAVNTDHYYNCCSDSRGFCGSVQGQCAYN